MKTNPERETAPPASRAAAQGAGSPTAVPSNGVTDRSALEGLGVVCMADVEPESIEWLWEGRIPRGKLTLLEGDPKTGKSTLTLDLVARVTTGSPMPDGQRLDAPGDVILLSAEDGKSDTIRPRLDAAGADVSRVHAWETVPMLKDGVHHGDRPPSLPTDLDRLEALIRVKGAVLVVIDVLNAYMGAGIDGHKDQDVRRALMPLAKMAERTGVAVVVLRHLNKSGGTNAMYRGGGSIGIGAAARSILLAMGDPEDDTKSRRVLAVTACNVSAPVSSLAYELVSAEDYDCARVEWLGATAHTSEGLLAAPASEDERSEEKEIADLLAELTKDGPIAVEDARQELKSAGFFPSTSTLSRAKRRAGLTAGKPEGFGGRRSYYRPHSVVSGPVSGVDHTGLTTLTREG